MGFGSSKPETPKPQPVTPVPQEDDPKGLEAKRDEAIRAKGQEGASAHLLSGEKGVEEDPLVTKKRLGVTTTHTS